MKRVFTVFFLSAFAVLMLQAQQSIDRSKVLKPVKYNKAVKQAAKTGFESVEQQISVPPSTLSAMRSGLEVQIGTTWYDLQTNSSMPRRVVLHDDGRVSGAFTYASDATYANRGTGYNTATAGGAWGPEPTARVETVRTGFTNLISTASGAEVTVSHPGAGGPVVNIKAPGASTWSQQTLTTPANGLWYRAASSGNYIHIIGITMPVANAGAIYSGVDGHMLYWRSPDNGATWDKQGTIIPGLDSTLFTAIGGDAYAIDAADDKVAVAVFNDWNDTVLFTSEDNGNTWAKEVIWDFPLDNYVTDAGYTYNDIPNDPDAPDSLAILTSDESGAVIIDVAGTVHVAFGSRYVSDGDLTDATSNFWLPVDGLNYWNSSTKTIEVVGFALDLNQNDTLDMTSTNVAHYNAKGLSTFPQFGFDDQFRLHLLYASTQENFTDQAGLTFRHLYWRSSADFGATWGDFYDLIDETTVGDQILAEITEAVYGSIPRNMTDKLHVVYQADYAAGIGVQDNHDDAENFIKYFTQSTTGVKAVQPAQFKFVVNPNPANHEAMVSFVLHQQAKGNIEIVNLIGQTVSRTTMTDFGTGLQQVPVQTELLQNGIYMIRLNLGDKTSTRKMVVAH